MSESDVILQTCGLSKDFEGFTALTNLDLSVRRGAVHALIGPNGAGKTTVFNLLTKFLRPTSGRIMYEGRDITRLEPAEVACLGVVRSFQISAVFPQLTVRDNVRVALQRRAGGTFAFWKRASTLDRLDNRVQKLLDEVGLGEHANLRAAEISYGRKRALEIATTLAAEPRLMLLDEPMAGLGREDIGRISQLIARIAKGRTIVMVEHNLKVVARLSTEITVLVRGRVLARGDYASVSTDPQVRQAYMGSAHA